MVPVARCSIMIARPLPEVFAYAIALERFGAWFPGVRAIAAANELAPSQPGKRYLETVSLPFRGLRRILITVVAAEPDRFFATEGALTPLLPRMEMRFAAEGDIGTRLDWQMLSRSGSRGVRLLLLPLARRVMQPRAEAGLRRLKALLEGAAP